MFLPGRNCLIHAVEAKFIRPVYVGDVLTVTGTVGEVHESVEQAVVKITIANQRGEKVLRGTLKVGILHEQPEDAALEESGGRAEACAAAESGGRADASAAAGDSGRMEMSVPGEGGGVS